MSVAMDGKSDSTVTEQPTSTPTGQKRKRKIISCYECRRNKLKCDHGHPCGRCERTGIGDICRYYTDDTIDRASKRLSTVNGVENAVAVKSPDAFSRAAESAYIITPADDMSMQMRMQTLQIKQLEKRLADLESGALKSPIKTPLSMGQEGTRDEPQEVETRIFRGKSFKTQFYGSTHPGSLVTHFPEIGSFMKDTIRHCPQLRQARGNLKAFKHRQKDPSIILALVTHLGLVSLLPPREVTKPMFELYFRTVEKTFRIVHEPSFWIEFEKYSKDPPTTPCGLVVQQLLMLACVKCMSPEEYRTYVGASSSSRETAISWIQASESWYNSVSRKHVTIVNYQVRCLLLLAKRLNSIKEKQIWAWSCDLLRFGMSAGLHREPSLLKGKISPFNQEMRRRLWATMVELELQMSIERGMPSSSVGVAMDARAPANINDEEFQDSFSQQDPVSKPWRECTSTTYLHVSHRSLPLRISLSAILNNPTINLSFDDVRHYEQKIVHELNTLPLWAHPESPRDPRSEATAVLLNVQLRQYLILLHAPFARQARHDPQFSYSRSVCLDSCRMILQSHIRLGKSGNHFLSMLRGDILQASLSMCHNLFLSTTSDTLHPNLSCAIAQPMPTVLEILQDQLLRLGKGFREYWVISATWGLLKSKFEPDQAESAKKAAVDGIMTVCYKVLASQERTKSDTFQGETTVEGCPPPAAEQTNTIPFNAAEFTDPFGWVLDDIWGVEQGRMDFWV